MNGKTIEAKLRIAAEVADAIAGLKSVRQELQATNKAAASAGAAGTDRSAGAAVKTETDQVVSQVQRRTAAERQAAAERKRVAKEELDAQKATVRETRKLADEQERDRRKQERDAERRRREQQAEQAKASRGRTYQAAALAPQLNDIFVGATTGQSPLTVALQQGPQIVQIYGGVRNTFNALLGVLTPLRVAIGGVAAGFGLLAVNAAAGYRESSQLNKALALSGNIANTSQGQINGLALDISAKQGASIGFVRDVLAEVIKLGGQTSSSIGATSSAVTALAKLTGQSAAEAVKGFEDQAAGVTDWSIKANRAYNFLTPAQVAYIRTLEQQGRTAEAIKFANDQLAQTLESRGAPAIGVIERAWNAAGRAVSFFLEQMKKVGREETAEERLEAIRVKLAELDARQAQRAAGGLFAGRRSTTDNAERERLLAEQSALIESRLLARKSAEAMRQNAAEIAKETKGFQELIANLSIAEAQKALAQKEADLDAQRELVERDYARQLIGASDQALKLNAIDQSRAQAQIALIKEQIAQQSKVKGDKPEDIKAQQVQLVQLNAQLIAAESRVNTAVSAGTRLIDSEIARLDQELNRRQDDNLAAQANRTADPQERARLAAAAATATARRELEQLERDLLNSQRAAAPEGVQVRQQKIVEEARRSVDELTRRAKLENFVQQTGELQQALASAEAGFDLQVQKGTLTVEDAEQRKFDARARALPQLRELAQAQLALAQSPAEVAAARAVIARFDELELESKQLALTLRTSVESGFADLFTSVLSGSKSALDAVKDFAAGVARAMLNLLAQRFAQRLAVGIFGSAVGVGATTAAPITTADVSWNAAVKHSGGLIGAAGGLARSVSPLVFAGAQVLHSGGLVSQQQMGLRRNEVPVIAEVGEEMLTEDNPRHIKNYRGAGVSMQASFTINGATGSEQDQRANVEQLQQMVLATVESWAAKQRRQGGVLASRS